MLDKIILVNINDNYKLSRLTNVKSTITVVDTIKPIIKLKENVKVKYNGAKYIGKGMSTDIVEASINAYIHAINKIVIMQFGGKK